jgi:error-prone DNA polymerase
MACRRKRITDTRQKRPYCSPDDLQQRTKLPAAIITRLARADAFTSLAIDRRAALWQALGQDNRELPLFADLADDAEPAAELPAMPRIDQVFADYRTTGLSLKGHPIAFYRPRLDKLRVVPAGKLGTSHDGRHLRVAGMVLLRQRPGTARGITFVTLEDETGQANLVIRPAIWEQYYKIARRSPAWIAYGRLECKESVIHLVVSRLEDLSERLREVNVRPRDFH